ncbi:uncharacterized [Tachysurus ichikawai]
MYKSRSRFQGCEVTPVFISKKNLILPDFPAHSQAVRTSPASSDFKVAPMAGICGVVSGGFVASRRMFTIIRWFSREDLLRVGAEKNPLASGADSRRRTEPSRADCGVHGCCWRISQQNGGMKDSDNASFVFISGTGSRQTLHAV